MLDTGINAPDFCLRDRNGTQKKLSDYLGKRVILYFYPKDNTGGCTKQAVGYRALKDSIDRLGIEIIGVSRDSVASHKKFREKNSLNFTLLSDPERKVTELYDTWKEKKNYGKTAMGVVRTTYLIDEDGIIRFANDKVKAADDAASMLSMLENK